MRPRRSVLSSSSLLRNEQPWQEGWWGRGPAQFPPSTIGVWIILETMCLFKKPTSCMDLASLPLILLAAAPALKNHCLEEGKSPKNRQSKIGTLCISTRFLCDRTAQLIESLLVICVFLFLIIWRDLSVGSEEKNKRGNISPCFCWVCSGTGSLLRALRVEMWVSGPRKEKKKKKRGRKAKHSFSA